MKNPSSGGREAESDQRKRGKERPQERGRDWSIEERQRVTRGREAESDQRKRGRE